MLLGVRYAGDQKYLWGNRGKKGVGKALTPPLAAELLGRPFEDDKGHQQFGCREHEDWHQDREEHLRSLHVGDPRPGRAALMWTWQAGVRSPFGGSPWFNSAGSPS